MCESEPSIWDKINVFVSSLEHLSLQSFYRQEKFYAGEKVADNIFKLRDTKVR